MRTSGMRRHAAAALMAALGSATLAQALSPAAMRFQALGAEFTPVQGIPPGNKALGTYHRCTFTGLPDHLEDYLTPSQLSIEDQYYYGRDRRRHYFQHLFVESECSNGLPKGHCLSSILRAEHCGYSQDWSVLAADERDGPGIMWRNERVCVNSRAEDEKNASVTVGYFCPRQPEDVHLYACIFEGAPAPADRSAAHAMANADVTRGYYEHFFSIEECVNGLPPAPSADSPVPCFTSLRWMEHCGDDHDWQAIAPGEDKRGVGVRWYSAHACPKARVAVDFFCAKGPGGVEFQRQLHRCAHKGAVTPAPHQDSCREAHRWGPAPAKGADTGAAHGVCQLHRFTDEQCTNGLPAGECIPALAALRECGQEQEVRVLGPQDMGGRGAAMAWYNGLKGGPCGPADLRADFYCYNRCVRRCNNGGRLDRRSCSCDCAAGRSASFWTGVECEVCGGSDADCPRWARFDKRSCSCVRR